MHIVHKEGVRSWLHNGRPCGLLGIPPVASLQHEASAERLRIRVEGIVQPRPDPQERNYHLNLMEILWTPLKTPNSV